jgi:hypothetical protein
MLRARGVGGWAAAQSWPKRTKSFQQIALGGIDSRQNRSDHVIEKCKTGPQLRTGPDFLNNRVAQTESGTGGRPTSGNAGATA